MLSVRKLFVEPISKALPNTYVHPIPFNVTGLLKILPFVVIVLVPVAPDNVILPVNVLVIPVEESVILPLMLIGAVPAHVMLPVAGPPIVKEAQRS